MIAMHMCKEFYDLIQRKLQANNHEVYFVMMGEPKCCDPYKNPASSSNCARYCVGKLVSRITNHISSAKLSVCIAMYNFNNHQLADCVLRAHRRGAKVRIIIDRSSCNKKNTKSPAHRLRNAGKSMTSFIGMALKSSTIAFAGISIRVSGEQHKLMHHKFCLIDATTANGVLITGSLNWTYGVSAA